MSTISSSQENSPADRHATAATLYALGGQRLAADDAEGAITAYRQCLTLTAPTAALLNNLGAALIRARRPDEAVDSLESALRLDPGYVRALVNVGKALRDCGRPAEAIGRLRAALAITPNYLPALINLGDALAASGDFAAAEATLEDARRIQPTTPEVLTALGMVQLQRGRVNIAMSSLRAAVHCAPAHADAHSNLAHGLFTTGEWADAWPHFEYRLQRTGHRSALRPPAGMQRWDGAIGPDLELWLVGEQGLGDQLQFSRYAGVLAERGIACVLATDPRLVRLFQGAGVAPRVVSYDESTTRSSARWVPLMSLPAWHRTTQQTVPAVQGYLTPDPQRTDSWRTRLGDIGGLRVAIAWSGNPRMETGRYHGRSPPLATLAPLFAVPDVHFVSVQRGPGEEQLDAVPFGSAITRLPGLDAGADAFVDSAAVLRCVDLLITSDTSIAHLGGALGVPTWVCLTHDPDWRWMLTGDRTPWYDSIRLFRQRTPGDWASVYRCVADELRRRGVELSMASPRSGS